MFGNHGNLSQAVCNRVQKISLILIEKIKDIPGKFLIAIVVGILA